MSKLLRMLLFVMVVVAPILLLFPILIGSLTDGKSHPVLRLAALPAWTVGGALALQTVRSFWKQGGGTPAPNAPTQRLVVSGIFRFTRNPMYIGALLIVFGHAVWFGTPWLWVYLAALGIFFHSVITQYEEPRLEQQFGEAYREYCHTVPRWLKIGRSIGS